MHTTTKFEELVAIELRNDQYLPSEDREILLSDVDGWVSTLKKMKNNCEVQFTNLKMLRAEKELSLSSGEITENEFNLWLVEHYNKRLNTSRFLKSIEFRLAEVKNARRREVKIDIPVNANA